MTGAWLFLFVTRIALSTSALAARLALARWHDAQIGPRA